MKFNPLTKYFCKFLGIFCILYYGTYVFIGLSVPGGYYVSIFDHYLNYPTWLRTSILAGSKFLLGILGYRASIQDRFVLRLEDLTYVRLVYGCLAYGIMSFWIAFVFSNKGTFKKKSLWVLGGVVGIWLINIVRISALLVANSTQTKLPFGMDHHTLFDICAYTLVFTMIYLYDTRFFARHKQFLET